MELEDIVESIGKLSDSLEASRWDLCREIETAFSEFHSYSRGLVEGLSKRLRKSTDSIYDMRDAARLEDMLIKSGGVSEIPRLSSSHYSVMYGLQDRYEIPIAEVVEWLILAEKEHLHIRELREEVSTKYRDDNRKSLLRSVHKIERLSRRIWEDSESLGMPEDVRESLRTFMSVEGDCMDKIKGWLV